MSIPAINLRNLPTDIREWDREFADVNREIRKRGTRVFANDQRFLSQVSSANKQSTQSVQPLTSTDSGGGLAEIQVASHFVQYSFGQVAYSSGTISGLANNTLVYVYTLDQDYEGGAVTYLSTTNPNGVTANPNRLYVGKITTAAGGGGGTSGGWGGGGGGGGNPLP